MIKFENLALDVDDGNNLNINPECKFVTSKIIIKGVGNSVTISKNLLYSSLVINLKGNNKEIFISESEKKINYLKITSIRGRNQKVFIGTNFSCGGLEIQMNDGDEKVEIGDECLFSWGIKIRTSDGHSVVDIETNKAINLPKDVVISNKVWVGEDVRFLKGARIPENTVVGAGSIVTKYFSDEDSHSVIGGVPSKVLKRGITWDRRMPYEYNNMPPDNLGEEQ